MPIHVEKYKNNFSLYLYSEITIFELKQSWICRTGSDCSLLLGIDNITNEQISVQSYVVSLKLNKSALALLYGYSPFTKKCLRTPQK